MSQSMENLKRKKTQQLSNSKGTQRFIIASRKGKP